MNAWTAFGIDDNVTSTEFSAHGRVSRTPSPVLVAEWPLPSLCKGAGREWDPNY